MKLDILISTRIRLFLNEINSRRLTQQLKVVNDIIEDLLSEKNTSVQLKLIQLKLKTLENENQVVTRDNLDAIWLIAYCYEKGIGVTNDKERAVKLFQLAAALGCTRAQSELALCYMHGIGVSIDRERAVEILYFCTARGYAWAQFLLASCYAHGTGVLTNEVRALELFQRAAAQGDAEAQYILGVYYQEGVMIQKDINLSAEFYKLAAEQGHEKAQLFLKYYYKNSMGDAKRIEEFYKLIFEQGPIAKAQKVQEIKANEEEEIRRAETERKQREQIKHEKAQAARQAKEEALLEELMAAEKKGIYCLRLINWGIKAKQCPQALGITTEINLGKPGIQLLIQNLKEMTEKIPQLLLIKICELSQEKEIYERACKKEKDAVFAKMIMLEKRSRDLSDNLKLKNTIKEITSNIEAIRALVLESQSNIELKAYQPIRKRKGGLLQNKIQTHIENNKERLKKLKEIDDILLTHLEVIGKYREQLPYYFVTVVEKYKEALKTKKIEVAEQCCQRLEKRFEQYELKLKEITQLDDTLKQMKQKVLKQQEEENKHIKVANRPRNNPATCKEMTITFSKKIEEFSAKLTKIDEIQESLNNEKRREAWLLKQALNKKLAQEKAEQRLRLAPKKKNSFVASPVSAVSLDSKRKVRQRTLAQFELVEKSNFQTEFVILKALCERVMAVQEEEHKNLKKYALLGGIARFFEMAKKINNGTWDQALVRSMRNNLFHGLETRLLPNADEKEIFEKVMEFALELATFGKKSEKLNIQNIGQYIKSSLLPYFLGQNGDLSLKECIEEIEKTQKQLAAIKHCSEPNIQRITKEASYYLVSRLDAFKADFNRKSKDVQTSILKQDEKSNTENRELLDKGQKLLWSLENYSKVAKFYRHESREQVEKIPKSPVTAVLDFLVKLPDTKEEDELNKIYQQLTLLKNKDEVKSDMEDPMGKINQFFQNASSPLAEDILGYDKKRRLH